MAKNNLTLEQKEIIKQLTDEFTKLNNTTPISTGLIDVNEIMETSRLEKEFENECTLANKTFSKLKCDAMLKDMESIRGDLALLNLGVQRSYEGSHSFEIYPTHKPYDKIEHYHMVRIEYKDSHHYERTLNKLKRNISCQYRISMSISQVSNVVSPTFAEFIKTQSFKEKLKYLYELTIK